MEFPVEKLSIRPSGEAVALTALPPEHAAAEAARAQAAREEAALVDQLRAGQEDAFAALIAQYSRPIYSLLARSLQDPADAADITQEVFIKVFRGIRQFAGESSLRTWIYRIALHEASNRRRWWTRHRKAEVAMDASAGRWGDDDDATFGETLADDAASPFDTAAGREVQARVEAALGEVPEPFRTAVILRDIEGFAYDEMATILDLNIGTVKSRIVRGRNLLKARLAQYVEQARRPVALVAREAR